jgi:hypothetical protein
MDEDNNLYKGDADELLERESSSRLLSRICIIFIGFSIAFCAHSVYSMVGFLTDASIPLVTCPRNYVVDAPVLMKPIRDESALTQDRWIRGFTRRYILSSFPRVKDDVIPFFQFLVDHSEGEVKVKYQSLLKDTEEIQAIINSGSYYKFYPKHVDDGGSAIRIRPAEEAGKWVVEVDGYLVKKMNNIQERYTPTLRYTVEAGKPTLTNPEGLYVTDGTIEQITDYVSNTKEKL